MKRVRLVIASAWLGFSAAAAGATGDPGFSASMSAAMERMMAAMHVEPSGDVDRDFVAMMVPHHQGAIEMAIAELRHGQDPRLRRIAQEIIIEQQQEIAAMNLAVGIPLPTAVPAPTQQVPHHAAGGQSR